MAFSFGGFNAGTGAAFGTGGTGSSIFGTGAATAPTTGFGFGTTPAAGTTGFGFGTQPAASTTGGFSFGGAPATTTTNTGGFGFGTAPASTGFGFGTTSTQPASTGFGFGFGQPTQPQAPQGFGFGFSNPQQPQLFQPQPQPIQLLNPKTKFSDLPEALRKQFLELDNFIHQQSLIRDEINAHSSPLDTVSTSSAVTAVASSVSNGTTATSGSLRASIESISSQISSLSLKLNDELLQLSNFEAGVTEQFREGEAAQRNVAKLLQGGYASNTADALKAGGRLNAAGAYLNEKIYLPSPYHWSKLDTFVASIHSLTTQISVVEEYLLTSAQAAQGSGSLLSSPQSLTTILQAQHSALVSVSGRMSLLHEQVAAVRDKFTSVFGREGARRLEEERKKEQRKREAFDLNAPNAAPLVSSVTGNTNNVTAGTTATTTTTAAAPAATTTAGFTLAPAPTTTAAPSTGLFGATTAVPAATTAAAPAAGGFSFGGTTTAAAPAATGFGFGTTPAAAPAASAFGGFGFGTPTTNNALPPASKPGNLSRQKSVVKR